MVPAATSETEANLPEIFRESHKDNPIRHADKLIKVNFFLIFNIFLEELISFCSLGCECHDQRISTRGFSEY